MSSRRILSFKTSRYGTQALYTFTPFKLLRAQRGDEYVLILADTYHHGVVLGSWHSKAVKDEFFFNLPGGLRKTILQPYELYPTVFTRGKPDRYVFEARNRNWRWSYYPEYIELSWETLKGAYYCAFGWVLLSSRDDDCPLARYCPFRRGTPCKYYSGPIAYSSLYNVYPIIRKKYEPPQDKQEHLPLIAIRYENMPLFTVSYIPNGSYVAFIDGVQFAPKNAKMYRQPLLFLKEGIGFRISQAPAIQFEFNKDTLREMIRDRLDKNPTLVRWIRLKQRLYLDLDDDLVREAKGTNAFQRMDELAALALSEGQVVSSQNRHILDSIEEAKVDDDLIDFASVLVVHSLSHLVLNWISARYGYGKGDLGYYLEHDKIQRTGLQAEGVRFFIFEAAIGGLGYLESFAQDVIKPGKNTFEELFGSENHGVQAILEFCEKRSNQAVKNLSKELHNLHNSEGIADNLINAVLAAYTRSFPNSDVYPHVNSIRRAIANTIGEVPEARGLLDDLLARGPHCWDGCQLCVMLERGCNYLPFDQPFLVTSRLTKDIVELLKRMVTSPIQVFPLKVGIEREFQRFLSTAKHGIDLVSPWISPEVIEKLAEKAEELSIRIITSKDLTNKVQVESLEVLEGMSHRLKVKISEQLHAKGMLVDDIMLMTGSFNFTTSGLTSNVENLTIDFSLQGTKDFKREFESMWNTSLPLV